MEVFSEKKTKILVFDKGEKLMAGLTEYFSRPGAASGVLTGLGAVEDVELGYYRLEQKEYLRKTHSGGDYELLSLHGNVTLKDGKPFVHAHVVLGDESFNALGGHLFECTVAVTVEISVVEIDVWPKRKHIDAIGLSLICPG